MGDNLFLIGFMGAGKTSFGKRLARKLKWKFLDADREIEKSENRSISAIFETEGESGFREIESNWLAGLDCKETIVSLGGGTPCFNNNLQVINKKGNSIYLELPPKILFDRLVNSKTKRPLIDNLRKNPTELLSFIEQLLKEREVFYNKADITVSGMSFSTERLEQLLIELKKL